MAPVYGTIERPRRLRLRSDRLSGNYTEVINNVAISRCVISPLATILPELRKTLDSRLMNALA